MSVKKPVNSPRKPFPTISHEVPKFGITSLVFQFDDTGSQESVHIIPLNDQHFKEVSLKKRKNGNNKQEASYVLVLSHDDLNSLTRCIKTREKFFSVEEMQEKDAEIKQKDERIELLQKQIGYLNSSSTANLYDTRTWAEKNVAQIGILSFAAGVAFVSSLWLYHLKYIN
jgi:hypothetical protein